MVTSKDQVEDLMSEMVMECQELDEDDPNNNPVSCVIDTIKNLPDEVADARPRFIILTQEDCEPCAEVVPQFQRLIDDGLVDQIDTDTDEGQQVMEQTGLKFTPALAVLHADGDLMFELFRGDG
jgi:hypothetical protein